MEKKENKKKGNEALQKIIKKIADKIRIFIESPYKLFKILISIFILVFLSIVWIFIYSYIINIWLNEKAHNLINDENLIIWIVEKNIIDKIENKNLDWIIKYFDEQMKTKEGLNKSFNLMQIPYNYFLKNLFLPSMNIWYDPYKKQYNLDIYWDEYLKKDPFIDINLMRSWWDFFKKVDSDLEFNNIKYIKIWWLEEYNNWYVKTKIWVEFTASQRRSFLMLINKLSISSNKRNISLINEFTSTLWSTIKEKKAKELEDATKSKIKKDEKITEDELNLSLWEELYNWVLSYCGNERTDFEKSNCQKKYSKYSFNKLLTEDVIEETIKKSASCDETKNWWISSICYMKFREKFRDIPFLAYTIWGNSKQKADLLKKFYFDLPPALNITKFTFSKWDKIWVWEWDNEYKGTIEIEVYWRNLEDEDLNKIQNELWEKCYSSWNILTVDLAMQKIDQRLSEISQKKEGNDSEFNSTALRDLSDLKNIFTEISSSYGWLPRYKKAIKILEIYRMLNDGNLCKTK